MSYSHVIDSYDWIAFFRALILAEPDRMSKRDFVMKVGLWLSALDKELRLVRVV